MGYLSHPYAWRLRSASFAGATIERLQYRDTLDVVIRFADWRGRRFQPKALEIGEGELLVLLGDSLAAGVFSPMFAGELAYLTMVNMTITHGARSEKLNDDIATAIARYSEAQSGIDPRRRKLNSVLSKEECIQIAHIVRAAIHDSGLVVAEYDAGGVSMKKYANEQWEINEEGLDTTGDNPTYEIDARRLTEKTDRLGIIYYDWPLHMAEKTWVNIDLFLEAYEKALEIHRGKYADEVDPAMLSRSLAKARKDALSS